MKEGQQRVTPIEAAVDLGGEGKRTGKGRGTKSENGGEKEKEIRTLGAAVLFIRPR